jgi:hypothetical protein
MKNKILYLLVEMNNHIIEELVNTIVSMLIIATNVVKKLGIVILL